MANNCSGNSSLCALLFLFAIAALSPSAGASQTDPPSHTPLQSALSAADRKDWATAESAVLQAAGDPAFESQPESTRHLTLALAAQVLLQAKKPAEALPFARRATQMPEQDPEDWRYRLSAAYALDDAREGAECIVEIYNRWGPNAGILNDDAIRRVFRQTIRPGLDDVRLRMLDTLYENRWRPSNGSSASAEWLELTRLLLSANQTGRAAEVAVLIDSPDDVISLQSNDQFRAVRGARFVRDNAERAAQDRIQAMRQEVASNPSSLYPVERLMHALIIYRKDAEALALSDGVENRIRELDGPRAYADYNRTYSQVLDARSKALRHLGRYDEAVEALRRATLLQDRTDKVSQPLDLAMLLCELGRAGEALGYIPPDDQLSVYGKIVAASVRQFAALESGNTDEAARNLAYIREHRWSAPTLFQHALLRADAGGEAEQWLLERLADPATRISALAEVQRYFEPPRPPPQARLYESYAALDTSPAVRAAVERTGGHIGVYKWRYDIDD
jgi:tetratricopeptide (TPR) repeat protein